MLIWTIVAVILVAVVVGDTLAANGRARGRNRDQDAWAGIPSAADGTRTNVAWRPARPASLAGAPGAGQPLGADHLSTSVEPAVAARAGPA